MPVMASTTDTMSILGALPSLTESLQAASGSIPSLETVQAPENGISLLDAKNEIFLSYLQSLALRNLELIRDVREIVSGRKLPTSEGSSKVQDQIVDNLIRQRVYLEKGVRPLEERLKYTIDKTLRAAAEEDRKTESNHVGKSPGQKSEKPARTGSTSQAEDDDGSSDEDTSDDEDGGVLAPNQRAMIQQSNKTISGTPRAKLESDSKSGVYRPPRVTATAMPENFDRASRRKERPDRSRTMDEYVSAELADGPTAQPSIGSTIAQGGRRQISARERAVEQERRDYEETHLMRLPKQSNKDKAKRGGRDGGFGGEEWRGLGDGLDRIDSLTRGVKRKDKEGRVGKEQKETGCRGRAEAGRHSRWPVRQEEEEDDAEAKVVSVI